MGGLDFWGGESEPGGGRGREGEGEGGLGGGAFGGGRRRGGKGGGLCQLRNEEKKFVYLNKTK